MITSFHIPDETFAKLKELATKQGGPKASNSKFISSLVEKEYSLKNLYDEGEEETGGGNDGISEQSRGEQNDHAGTGTE